jgi:hypothetical protein
MPARARGLGQAGSVLMLVPAAVLVLVILGSLAVDTAVTFMGQRELASAAAAAANDAAGAALSDESFYRREAGQPAVVLDPDLARRLVDQAVRARAPRGVDLTGMDVRASGGQICVVLHGRVDRLFGKAIPGVPGQTAVEARATATAVEGPPGAAVAPRPAC